MSVTRLVRREAIARFASEVEDFKRLVLAWAFVADAIARNFAQVLTSSCADAERLSNDSTYPKSNAKSLKLINEVCGPALTMISKQVSELRLKVEDDNRR